MAPPRNVQPAATGAVHEIALSSTAARRGNHVRLDEEVEDMQQEKDIESFAHPTTPASRARPARRIQARWRSRSAAGATGATVVACIANLANTNMGVGMLALPAAMSNAGFLGGTVLLLFSASVAAFASHLLAECVNTVGRPATLSTVTARALGVKGILLTDAAVVIIGTSCAIGYLIVVGDMLPEIARWMVGGGGADPAHGHNASRELWILAAVPIVGPLAFLRRLESLGSASTFVVVCVGAIIITVLVYAVGLAPSTDPCVAALHSALAPNLSGVAMGAANGSGLTMGAMMGACPARAEPSVVPLRDASHTLSSLPTFLFAFAAQINVPSIVSELRQPTPSRVSRVLFGGMGLTAAAYFLVAIAAYSTYGVAVSPDVLVFHDFPSPSIAVHHRPSSSRAGESRRTRLLPAERHRRPRRHGLRRAPLPSGRLLPGRPVPRQHARDRRRGLSPPPSRLARRPSRRGR